MDNKKDPRKKSCPHERVGMILKLDSYVKAKATAIALMKDWLLKHSGKQGAIMLDIDDTLLNSGSGGEYKESGVTYLKPIKSITDIAKWARLHNVKVVIITARPNTKSTVLWTRKNLARAGVGYDHLLFLKSTDNPDNFKPLVKKALASMLKLKFILSVGDRPVDVMGGMNVSGVGIKLPSKN